MESALIVYACALDHLGFEQVYCDVGVADAKMWKLHTRFGAKRAGD